MLVPRKEINKVGSVLFFFQMTTVLGRFSCLRLHLVKQTQGLKEILFASFAVAVY